MKHHIVRSMMYNLPTVNKLRKMIVKLCDISVRPQTTHDLLAISTSISNEDIINGS